MAAVTPKVRPYRSHLMPACDLCRHRKTRCNIDQPNQPCRFCRERDLTCHYSARTPDEAVESRPPKRRKIDASNSQDAPRASERGLGQFPSVAGTSPDQSSMLLNPPMAEDVQYLTSNSANAVSSASPYSLISNLPGKPIVYVTVPRRRKGLVSVTEPGRAQREIIEQVLGPYRDDVVKLYFEKLHPCFPILDEVAFQGLWQKDPTRIPSVLICDLYAAALHFWDTSPRLRQHPRPDLAFIWNQAVAAIQEDFQGATISTVHASLLDLIGRPVFSITGNIVMLGRTVTLAHSLGLHRDPTSWKATEHEKAVRIRLWHGVLIHDCWSSLAHGTPPLINSQNSDVPLPVVDHLSDMHKNSNVSFLHLCSLTRILGDLLPYVYALEFDSREVSRNIRKLECKLDDWEVALPESLKMHDIASQPHLNGSSSLYFCFLSVKLLLCRLAFKISITDQSSILAEAKSYRLAMLREAAFKVTNYISSLTSSQLGEFWLCYVGHLLVTTTTILLRCLLETTDVAIKRECAKKLLHFRDRMQIARDDSDWDLADFCLERCSEPISKIAAACVTSNGERAAPLSEEPVESSPDEYTIGPDADLSSLLNDFLLPMDSLDYHFNAIWDI